MTTPTIPSTMRAWQYSSTKGGLPQNLAINPKTPVPTPGPNEFLIKVKAVALNPVDYKPAEVWLFHRLAIPKPATPGVDFVGEVVLSAAGSTFKPGQLVFGVGKNPFAGGMLAEYALAGTDSVIALGKGMDPIDAASIGIAGLTAYQSILRGPKSSSRIFINGGSGGTGIFGIQIAKALGHEVTVTCSSRNVKLCQSLGAEVIDYSTTPVVEALKKTAATRKFDLVIDNVGSNSSLYWKAHEYTNTGARYIAIAGKLELGFLLESLKMKLWPGFLGGGRRKQEGFFAQTDVKHLTLIRTWFEEGKVKAVTDQVFPFEEAVQAFEKLKTGRAVGKIIVGVEPLGS